MRIKAWPLSLLLFACIVSPPGAAQTKTSSTTNTAGGLHVVTFEDRHGTVTVYLPDDLAAGDTISGTVEVEPSGRTDEQRRKNSGELSGYVIEMEDQKSPAAAGPIKRSAPAALAGGTTRVVLRDENGREVATATVPVLDAGGPSTGGFMLPRTGQTGRTTQVTGPFDGDSATTRAAVGGRDVKVLAESPRRIVVQCPEDVVGPTEIEVREGDATAKGEFRNVQVLLSAPKTSLIRGETTEMRVEVRGLAGLEEPLSLRVVNLSPSVVRVEGGDTQTIAIPPGDVQSGGRYTTARTLTGSRSGSFNITTDVVPPGPVFQPAPQPGGQQGQPSPPQPQQPRRKPGEGDLRGSSTRKDTIENLPGGKTVEVTVERKLDHLKDTITQTLENYDGAEVEQTIERRYVEKEIDGKKEWGWEETEATITRKTGGANPRTEKWNRNEKGEFVKQGRGGRPVLDRNGNPEVYDASWLKLELPQEEPLPERRPLDPNKQRDTDTVNNVNVNFTRPNEPRKYVVVKVQVQRSMVAQDPNRERIVQTVENYEGMTLVHETRRERRNGIWQVKEYSYSETRRDEAGRTVVTTEKYEVDADGGIKEDAILTRKIGDEVVEWRWQAVTIGGKTEGRYVKLDKDGQPVLVNGEWVLLPQEEDIFTPLFFALKLPEK